MKFRVGALSTHPVQYQAPWFRGLAAMPEVDLTVFYAMIPDSHQQGVGFGVDFQWDVPLLDGYRSEILENVAPKPALGTFGGCDTPSLTRIVRKGGFDAFILTGWHTKSGLQGLWACRRSRVPAIVRAESNSLKRRPWYLRLLHRILLRQYAAFLVIGKANEAFYKANGASPRHFFPGWYCVDNERFAAQSESLRLCRPRIRSEWRVPENAFTFLFAGKLTPKKRPLDLVEALSGLRGDQSAAVHLLVAGDGPLNEEVRRRAEERAVPLTILGFLNQSQIAKAYVAADALVLPSDSGETWGLVVNEAMACGLPAVVSDQVGCQQDLVIDEETGAVFPCGDITALANTLRRIARDPGLASRLGANARALVAAYSSGALVEGSLAALRNVVGRSANSC
jgi:glycosyltransferase involved in cell wall biosynthesis